MKKYIVLLFLIVPGFLMAQKGTLQGLLVNAINNEPVPFANVLIYGTAIGSVSDLDGNFKFFGLEPGFVRVQVSSIGFETKVSDEIQVTNAKTRFIEIKVVESTTDLEEVTVKTSQFKRKEESPVSMRSIGIAEIEKNPGGNRDISKVIQSLPGVAGSVSFRNDIIVRGGGPSENRFYLDAVEIPNLNHFATQGASGGPVGMINVDFIRNVDFYSGAFPANRGNALSSVLDFQQIDGNKEKMKYRATIGASDLALTLDGPIGDKTSLVFSARRSYLQFLFQVIGLPFLPTYNDVQFKIKSHIDEKNEITFIGLGALDQFELNLKANETEEQRYILGYLPVNEQWNYTVGGIYKHYREKGYHTLVLSRNHLNNSAYKYLDNDETTPKIFDYKSDEVETKLRYENTMRTEKGFKINFGAGMEYAQYFNDTYQLRFVNNAPVAIDYETNLDLVKWSGFGQVSKGIFNQRLIVSLGLRMDANNYSSDMNNLFEQISPRLSLSYPIGDKWAANFNTGKFYQLPPYTTLGYGGQNGVLVNKDNGIKYIQSDHLVGGLEYLPNEKSKITLEGFYKKYNDYPFSVNDGVAISSKGSDFGTFGDEEVTPTGVGRSYGIELYMRHTSLFKFNTILSYTWVTSEFEDATGSYIPTAWDNKHLFNLTATRSFKNNWDFGFKYRFAAGAPYTPDDLVKSSYISAWDAQQRAYLDYSQFNSVRLNNFTQLDVRVDKSFYFDNWSFMVYLDIQNILGSKIDTPDILTVDTDVNGVKVIDNPGDPIADQRYKMRFIETNGQGTVLPTIGIMFEF
ncbi:MAG: TonB-dependent receptor [Salinivirgaceae bacterium]|nr:TonB-dependent receptor [Salinivirgaceae bacterium]